MLEQNWLNNITLIGKYVTLKALTLSHTQDIIEALSDGKLWELWYTSTPTPNFVNNYINTALEELSLGKSFPFIVVENKSNKIVGCTRFCNAEPINRRIEIGYTWYSKSYQRTIVNTECKYLLLTYAFEKLSTIAVEFRTNWHNHTSRKAIERLGAKQDGILRNHQLDNDGCYRDTVVFSIINNEWASVKKNLEFKIRRLST